MVTIESIKIRRAETLPEDARRKHGVSEGFIKILATRDSPAKVKLESFPNGASPASEFRKVMKK